jgi:hypothetical protein
MQSGVKHSSSAEEPLGGSLVTSEGEEDLSWRFVGLGDMIGLRGTFRNAVSGGNKYVRWVDDFLVFLFCCRLSWNLALDKAKQAT